MAKVSFDAAFDTGNSETEGIVNDVFDAQPSVIKRLYSTPDFPESSLEQAVGNLKDNLLVNITSKALARNGLFWVGKSAEQSGDNVENMNIKLGLKYKHDIPVITTLSMIASQALIQTFNKSKKLPETLSVDVQHSGDIPASEYTVEHAHHLENRFTEDTHVVILYVGKKQVTITINFIDSKVIKEGVPLLYALIDGEPDLFAEFEEEYNIKVNPQEYFLDKRILHIDIGDGTTELIVTKGLNPVPNASAGIKHGSGHAILEAIKMLSNSTGGYVNYNRQQFSAALLDPEDAHHRECEEFVKQTRYQEANQILEASQESFMSIAAGNADIITVYGGGSIALKDDLKNNLKTFADTVGAKLLWIPKNYAVILQVRGLNNLNKNVFYKKQG